MAGVKTALGVTVICLVSWQEVVFFFLDFHWETLMGKSVDKFLGLAVRSSTIGHIYFSKRVIAKLSLNILRLARVSQSFGGSWSGLRLTCSSRHHHHHLIAHSTTSFQELLLPLQGVCCNAGC